jgi:hypothetical protein
LVDRFVETYPANRNVTMWIKNLPRVTPRDATQHATLAGVETFACCSQLYYS